MHIHFHFGYSGTNKFQSCLQQQACDICGPGMYRLGIAATASRRKFKHREYCFFFTIAASIRIRWREIVLTVSTIALKCVISLHVLQAAGIVFLLLTAVATIFLEIHFNNIPTIRICGVEWIRMWIFPHSYYLVTFTTLSTPWSTISHVLHTM